MAQQIVWSLHEATMKIWEEDAAGAKINPSTPILQPLFVEGITLEVESDGRTIQQPGARETIHYSDDRATLTIQNRFHNFAIQDLSDAIFLRANTLGTNLAKKFLIELEYDRAGRTETKTFKECYATGGPSQSSTGDGAGITDNSFSFDVKLPDIAPVIT